MTAFELPTGVDEAQGVALAHPLAPPDKEALRVALCDPALDPEGRGELEGEGEGGVLALLNPLRLGVELPPPDEDTLGLSLADSAEDVEGWGGRVWEGEESLEAVPPGGAPPD